MKTLEIVCTEEADPSIRRRRAPVSSLLGRVGDNDRRRSSVSVCLFCQDPNATVTVEHTFSKPIGDLLHTGRARFCCQPDRMMTAQTLSLMTSRDHVVAQRHQP